MRSDKKAVGRCKTDVSAIRIHPESCTVKSFYLKNDKAVTETNRKIGGAFLPDETALYGAVK